MLLGGTAILAFLAVGAGHALNGRSSANGDRAPVVAAMDIDPTPLDVGVEPDPGAALMAGLLDEGAIALPSADAQPPDEYRAAAINGRFAMPLRTGFWVTDRYGAYRGRGLVHGGIDLALDPGHHWPVLGACLGTVATAEYSSTYGNYVIADCGDGWGTLYAHLTLTLVKVGAGVTFDTVVGASGSTGYSTGEHLHFEIRWQGTPVNPEDYLDFKIPPGTPLSWDWWADTRSLLTPSGRSARGGDGAAGAATNDPRAAATPVPTRAAPTATPTPVPVTATRYATPTPRPAPPTPIPTKPPVSR
jgi:hypothetical protein